MTSRTRLLITAAVVCHLLAAPRVVTSQLLPSSAAPDSSLRAAAKRNVPVTIIAEHQEKDGDVYKLEGNVRITYATYTVTADQVTYNSDTSQVEAEGHVLIAGGPNDENIEATRASLNLDQETGRFEQVRGSIGFEMRKNRPLLTTSNPFFFSGKLVEKTAPDHYIVSNGTVTTCELPRPKWQFNARKVVVDVGGNATIYHSNFRLEGIPILYFPFVTHPVEKEPRQSGFLIPNLGRSSTRGNTIGESLFWAISRSMDLYAGVEYYSLRGWAPDGVFRARPTENSFVYLTYFSVFDRGLNGVKQGGTEATLISEGSFAHDFRAVANLDYLSSYVFRLAFSDVFTQAVNSEVKSQAFLSKTTNDVFVNFTARRYQDFQSTTPGDVITILHAPTFDLSTAERQLWNWPFHGSVDVATEGLSRSEPGFSTAPLVGRFDLNPVISLPRLFKGWSFRPDLSLRDTIYTQQLVPSTGIALTDVGTAISKTLNRKSLEGEVEVRPPALEKVFGREFLGRKWMHVVETRMDYNYVTGVENFPHILRFDERDILSDTNEVQYAVTNRLYAKKTSAGEENCGPPGMPALMVGAAPPPDRIPWVRTTLTTAPPCPKQPETREVVTWDLAQKYFLDQDFGGALVPGRTNIFTTTVDLTGIAFLTEPRHLSPLISRLLVSTGPRDDFEWDADFDFFFGRVNSSTIFFNHHVGLFTLGFGNAYLNAPGAIVSPNQGPTDLQFNQYRAVLGYGNQNKRGFSGAFNLGLDARISQVQYGSLQAVYNWDCCGLNVEYRRFQLAEVRNENQFRFTFSLANVGAFGNLRRTERMF